MQDLTEAHVAKIPPCDIECTEPAAYDGKTVDGPWAYMCETHFRLLGVGLGTGKGQRLALYPATERNSK